ncbi:medium-chain acyl-CoA ligase ACSF2, mitochondrial-like [Lutzomyia longipalpis]|uniref:medium-chain acyl-CoA ligase ACSF2, mitochondrial-like n=1 Tax=Lutzomyia longipalpis TaxID=7200 RepID=UPI002483A452|nr:medium-chain acyl-CoA ligase ACSF2, mitochondrial-like [Lutzomyia longipalpis]
MTNIPIVVEDLIRRRVAQVVKKMPQSPGMRGEKGCENAARKSFIPTTFWNHSAQSGLSYFHNPGRYPLVHRTIGQELSHAVNKCSDREYIIGVEEKQKLTYQQIKTEADSLAAGFHCIGLKRGDRLGIWAPNVASWPVVMFAAARAGLILVALNPAYEATEMEFCLRKVGVKALVTSESFRSQDYYEKLQQIVPELISSDPGRIKCKKLPSLASILIDSEKNFAGTFRLCDVKSMPMASQIVGIEDQQKDISPDSGCCIMFTSGTTGNPKAALLKHSAVVNCGLHFDKIELLERKILLPVPFFHVFGLVPGIMGALTNQATIVIPSTTYNPEKSLLAIRNEKCSILYGTPTMFVDLVKKQKEIKLDIRPEIAFFGAAPSSPQLIQDMKKDLGLKKLKTAYGMTESTACSFISLPEDSDDQVCETIGYVNDHIEAKIIDKQGNIVPFGIPGELCVRGHFTMLKYWDDMEKTQKVLGSDGWLKTGDQFILQPNGYGKIVGRLKEIIIRGGENIFPKEIEDFLATCPEISEVYIVGVPDKRFGEEMCAYVRLQSGSQFTEKDIREYCNVS